MQKRLVDIVVGLGVVVVLWALFRPEKLFVNRKVNESLPATATSAPSMPTGTSTMAPAALLAGSFHSGAHETTGTASIYQLDGGKRGLRFTNFKTSKRPACHRYLVAAEEATDTHSVKKAGCRDLGSLKW